jgi:hypothetical protein
MVMQYSGLNAKNAKERREDAKKVGGSLLFPCVPLPIFALVAVKQRAPQSASHEKRSLPAKTTVNYRL